MEINVPLHRFFFVPFKVFTYKKEKALHAKAFDDKYFIEDSAHYTRETDVNTASQHSD
jgi:hypothetical protein